MLEVERPTRAAPQPLPPDSKGRIPYLPAVDGLRGLAVAAVVAYHAGMPWARGGFLGVDAFFVISGFLITALLLAEHDANGRIDLRGFWLRRARRLLPALLLVLLGVAVYAAWIADPAELREIRRDSLATIAYVANWKPILEGDSYFGQFAVPSPFMHTWSLAIEEQWYVIWPLVVVGALVLRPATNTLLILTVALALLSAAWMAVLYEPGGDPSRVYYGTDTRAQSLLVGACLAMVLRLPRVAGVAGVRTWHASAAGAIALVVLVACWTLVRYDTSLLYRGGFLMLAIFTAVAIATVTLSPQSLLARSLGCRPLRALGVISYGIYLWHWPLFIVLTPARLGADGYALLAVRVGATLLAATLSYLLVEQPIRRGALGRLPRPAWILAPAGAAAMIAIMIFTTTTPGGGPVAPALANTNTTTPPATSSATDIRLLVVGDSVAFTAGQGLARVGENWDVAVWNQAQLGCGVLRGDRVLLDGRWTDVAPECRDWPQRWKSYVDLYQPDAVVLLAGAWDVQDREVAGAVLEFGSPPADDFARTELDEAVRVLSSSGARVFLLTTPYFKQPDLALVSSSPRFNADRIAHLNAIYEDVAQDNTTAEVVDLASFLAASPTTAASVPEDEITSDGGPSAFPILDESEITSDGVHFTDAGADMVAGWLSPHIAATVTPRRNDVPSPALAQPPASAPRWLELLAGLPDTPSTRQAVALNDYARFREIFGLAPPIPGDAPSLAEDRRRLMFHASGQRSGLSPSSASGIIDAQHGLPLASGEAVEQDAWASNGAVQLVRTQNASEVTCAPACEPAGTLADVPAFRRLAEVVASTDAYALMLSLDAASFEVAPLARTIAGPDATHADIEATEAALRAQPILQPYAALATAASHDSSGSTLTIALLHEDDATAARNADLLRQRIGKTESWLTKAPYTALLEIIELRAEGPLLIAELRTTSAAYWFGLVSAHDTLLLHE